MAKSEDIVTISIPFSAGVSAAVVISTRIESYAYLYTTLCLYSAVLFLALFCRKGRQEFCAAALFFFLGMYCLFTASFCGWDGPHLFEAAARCAKSGFLNTIEGAGFSHESTEPLLKALLTGDRDGLSRDITESFRRSGASHILALSGLHLGILYGFTNKVLGWMGQSVAARYVRSAVIVTLAFGYTLLTGRGPSITRAFLFITINELSGLFPGRKHGIVFNYHISLMVQLAINPMIIKSLGFQLSYLAMFGVMVLNPRLESFYPKSTKFDPIRRMWRTVSLTISCQTFTAPLVWLRFRSFPLYFLLSNLISLPLTSALIYSALTAILLASVGVEADVIKSLTESLSQALLYCLNVISTIPQPS